MKQSNSESCITIAPKEMKELKRVYDQLCYFADKVHAVQRLKEISKLLSEYQRPPHPSTATLRSIVHSPTSSKKGAEDKSSPVRPRRSSCDPEEQEKIMIELQREQAELQKTLSEINNRPVQHIRPEDTAAALKSLGKKVTKKEVQDIMWEVDEKLDGVIDWEEFQLNFERNIRDLSGLEPASFYHMVQFMIYDRDDNGMVSIDETMNMLYARVGRDEMESTITKLFGGDDGAPIKEVGSQGGEIDFTRYWEVVVREQQQRFSESDLGKILSDKKQKKKKK
jgi:Ca2+-binding EF-hand superfamily protein